MINKKISKISYDYENSMKILTRNLSILSFEIGPFTSFLLHHYYIKKKKSIFLINLTLSQGETKFIETNHLIFRNL